VIRAAVTATLIAAAAVYLTTCFVLGVGIQGLMQGMEE
jgi:hypothetical protein